MLASNSFDRKRLKIKQALSSSSYLQSLRLAPNSRAYDMIVGLTLKFNACAEMEKSIHVAEVHDSTRSFPAFSFRIDKIEKRYSFAFDPVSSTDALSPRMTTHMGLPPGKNNNTESCHCSILLQAWLMKKLMRNILQVASFPKKRPCNKIASQTKLVPRLTERH